MKKTFYLSLLLFVFITSSCNSDDNNDETKISNSSWAGTEILTDGQYSTDIEFQSSTFSLRYKITYNDGSGYTEALTGSYIFDSPKLILKPNKTNEGYQIEFAVFKDKIVNAKYGTLMRK